MPSVTPHSVDSTYRTYWWLVDGAHNIRVSWILRSVHMPVNRPIGACSSIIIIIMFQSST